MTVTAAVAVVAVSAAAVSVTQGVSEQGAAGAAVVPGASAGTGSPGQDELMARCLGAAAVAAGDACEGRLGDQAWPSLETFAQDTSGQYPCWRAKSDEAFPDCGLRGSRGHVPGGAHR